MPTEHPQRPPRPHRDSLAAYLDDAGRVTRWPTRTAPREVVLIHLAGHVEYGTEYTESDLNALLDEWHTFNDAAVLRRALCDAGLLARERDGSRYRRTRPDLTS